MVVLLLGEPLTFKKCEGKKTEKERKRKIKSERGGVY